MGRRLTIPQPPEGSTRRFIAGRNGGFTLIELSLVVFLLGVMLALTLPTLRQTLVADPLKTSVNRIVTTAEHLDTEAQRERVDALLHLDLERRRIWTSSADMTPEGMRDRQENAWQLPDGVRILGIERFDGEMLRHGEVVIRFYSRGYREPSLLYLSRNSSHFSIIFEPFLPRIEVREGLYRRDRDGTYHRSTSW